jgi:hypothetical protein
MTLHTHHQVLQVDCFDHLMGGALSLLSAQLSFSCSLPALYQFLRVFTTESKLCLTEADGTSALSPQGATFWQACKLGIRVALRAKLDGLTVAVPWIQQVRLASTDTRAPCKRP